MSRLVSLTRPISAASPAGSLLPWERPYTTEPIATLAHNGANLFHIDMSPSASTRLLSSRVFDADGPSLRELDPSRLLNREADVVRVPRPAGARITAAELSAVLAGAPEGAGRALVLLTGWEHEGTGEESLLAAPFLERAAVDVLVAHLAERGIDLLLTDLPYLTAPDDSRVGEDWLGAPPWQRPSWPSPGAERYLAHHYPRDRVLDDWAPLRRVLERACLVLGIAGADAVTADRLRIHVAALQVRDVGEAPCTVVAEPRTTDHP